MSFTDSPAIWRTPRSAMRAEVVDAAVEDDDGVTFGTLETDGESASERRRDEQHLRAHNVYLHTCTGDVLPLCP